MITKSSAFGAEDITDTLKSKYYTSKNQAVPKEIQKVMEKWTAITKNTKPTLKKTQNLLITEKLKIQMDLEEMKEGDIGPHPLTLKTKVLKNEIRTRKWLSSSDLLLAPASTNGQTNEKKTTNTISIAQWNTWGLSHLGKINVINSVKCDLFMIQEINHPHLDLISNLHKTIINKQEREKDSKGGGTMTLSDLNFTSCQAYPVNKDTNLQRAILDGVFVFWIGNIYLNKGLPSQIQKLFSVIQNHVPDNERQNLLLIGDFNINLAEPKHPKVILLKNLCKQFQLTIHTPSKGTRGHAKLDFLISGSGIEAKQIEQLHTESDHDMITWEISFKATKRAEKVTIPNSKLARQITEQSVMDTAVTNSCELLNKFLTHRRLERKQAFIKLKSRKTNNNIYKKILMEITDEDSIMNEINLYWSNFWEEVEHKRYSPLSKEAFNTLKSICKYHLSEGKRDGSVVNQILMDNGVVTTDKNQVSAVLIEALKDMQYSEKFQQYTGSMPFPELPQLEEDELKTLLSSLSSGKAVSFDLFSDIVFRNKNLVDKLAKVLKDLWSSKLNEIEDLETIFLTRLIALNKVHPNIPQKNEFRPIIIMSAILKIMECRWLPKLKEYLITKLCPAQTGFVPGQGVFTNIFRAIKKIKERTNVKKPVYALFIDFKSAYNHTRHDLLFERLKGILTDDEIKFQQAIYDKLTIQLGNSSFKPNLGVAQGSVISPALFDIYTEPLLWELRKLLPIDDIFAYADDIMILCDKLETLDECVDIIENWSIDNNMKINKTKSAILEFIHRKKRITNLTIGENRRGYPIVSEYKYLGTWLNQKLTMDSQIKQIIKKTNFLREKLTPFLYTSSLDMRKNLWQMFICPSYEFLLPLYSFEQAKTKRTKVETLVRKSFKSYTGLKKTVESSLIDKLMAYNIQSRSKQIQYISEQKWIYRLEGKTYKQEADNRTESQQEMKIKNWCKNQPKSLIKFINIQTALCPKCKEKGFTTRCTRSHLAKVHHIKVESIETIVDTILELTEEQTRKKRDDETKLSRENLVKKANEIIQPNLHKLKNFLNTHNVKSLNVC
jgi:hypothetical protein